MPIKKQPLKTYKYREHVITYTPDGFGSLLGTCWNIEGHTLNGMTGGTLQRVKEWIDKEIAQKECFTKTKHANEVTVNHRTSCGDCGMLLGLGLR